MSTLVALGLVILVVAMLASYQMGYAAGSKDGYGRGHADGKKDGVSRAYAVGFDRGRRAGREKEAEAAAEPATPESRVRSVWLPAIVALLALLAFVAMMARLARERSAASSAWDAFHRGGSHARPEGSACG